jgi:hypothetical protein
MTDFGPLSVTEDGQISFNENGLKTVLEAEEFMCHLIDAITHARKLIGDPI